jgi:hypothetical protein
MTLYAIAGVAIAAIGFSIWELWLPVENYPELTD